MNNEQKLYKLITEELSKSEISSMITSRLDSSLNSSDFKKKVKEIAADVVEQLYKNLWQRSNFWKSAVKN